MTTSRANSTLFVLLAVAAAACSACAAIDGGGSSPDLRANNGPWNDFTAAPLLDSAGPLQVPPGASDLFGPAGSGTPMGGPCLLQPEAGTLFPSDWLRLRVSFVAPANQNLFEIRLHADNQINDLVVYTTAQQWTMPAGMWSSLTQHSTDIRISVDVRGAELASEALAGPPSLGSPADFTVAPVPAGGTVVYWTSSGGTALRGFKIGDETVHEVLKPSQAAGGTRCIGCHSSTPDGSFVAFSQSTSAGDGSFASVGLRTVDGLTTEPSFVSDPARALLGRVPQQLPSFSPKHWTMGDRVMISTLPVSGQYEIVWTDLEAKSQAQGVAWGVVARAGDQKQAATPVFSHSGQSIAYVSEAAPQYGVITMNGDLYTVPYGPRSGGQAMPVQGASDRAYNEFYPAFSPDDSLLAFSRVQTGETSYNDVASEIFVVAASGGAATRLVGNDPPSCGGRRSPGVFNSWPKWSPETQVVNGRQFYWLSFSSVRSGAVPQLYVVGVVVEAGIVRSYGAAYLWNQPASDSNHTAAWDVFRLIVG